MLEGIGSDSFGSDRVRQGIIEFYANMNGFVFDKVFTCTCTAYLDVLKDTFTIMAKLGIYILTRI